MIGNKKGQTSLLELLIGSTLVLLIFVALLNSFKTTFMGAQTQAEFEETFRASEKALDALTRSPGLTIDQKTTWEKKELIADINQFGLAISPLVLSEAKLKRFVEWTNVETDGPEENYQRVKEILGLGKYDFSITIFVRTCQDENCHSTIEHLVKDSTGKVAYSEIGKGATQIDYAASRLVLERPVVLEAGTYDSGTQVLKNDAAVLRLRVYAKQ